MTDPTQTTGTPEQDGGDAAEVPTAGTPVADDRNADHGINREEALVWKSKAERLNAAEAEAKAYKAQLDALTRSQSPAANGSDPRAERLATVKRFAEGTIGEGPDPVAAEVLELREALAMTVAELTNVRELDRVADEDKRSRIAKHFNDNRHRLGDVKAARAEIEAEERAAKGAEQEAEIERLKKALEAQAKRPGSDVVQTHTREVSAAEHKDIMTQAQWNERQAMLERQADSGDLEAIKIRRREQVARANGKLRVEG